MLGILYDIHGNLVALEAVLAEAETLGIKRWLLGGDYCAFGPWPARTLERLADLPGATWLRGNGERWLVDPPLELPVEQSQFIFAGLAATIAELPEGRVDQLIGLPAFFAEGDFFWCHGSPRSDVESFAAEPGEDDERLLAGIREQTVVFGHSHLQFQRSGPNGTVLVNPGSVGMPLDRDPRAAWAVLHEGASIELRRTGYDAGSAIRRMRELDWGERVAHRLERGSDD